MRSTRSRFSFPLLSLAALLCGLAALVAAWQTPVAADDSASDAIDQSAASVASGIAASDMEGAAENAQLHAPLGPPALAPATTGGIDLVDRALAKLATHRRLLVIGAHPDDEDTSALTLVSREQGGEAAYLALSRGEGGQNLIGPELQVDLGVFAPGSCWRPAGSTAGASSSPAPTTSATRARSTRPSRSGRSRSCWRTRCG